MRAVKQSASFGVLWSVDRQLAALFNIWLMPTAL